MCSITVSIGTGDVIEWYFTKTNIESATTIEIDGSKYSVDGELSQILIVNNVSLNDEGYYFCQLRQNDGQLIRQQGSCLRVLGKSMCQVYGIMMIKYTLSLPPSLPLSLPPSHLTNPR